MGGLKWKDHLEFGYFACNEASIVGRGIHMMSGWMRWFVHHEARNQEAHLWKSWMMRNCTIVKCWFYIHPLSHVVEHLRDGSCSDSLLFISIIIIIICSSCGFLHHHNSYIYMRWKPCCRDGSRSRCDDDPRDSIQDCCHMAEDCEEAALNTFIIIVKMSLYG